MLAVDAIEAFWMTQPPVTWIVLTDPICLYRITLAGPVDILQNGIFHQGRTNFRKKEGAFRLNASTRVYV
jgi:hypothetical protein